VRMPSYSVPICGVGARWLSPTVPNGPLPGGSLVEFGVLFTERGIFAH
jgi:hypothetical protein